MKVEGLLGDVHKRAETEDASVVDKNVEASEGGVDFFEQPRNLRGLGYVGPDRNCFTPGCR